MTDQSDVAIDQSRTVVEAEQKTSTRYQEPEIVIHIQGTIQSGKSRLAARIARLVEEETGFPYTVISQDGDFMDKYRRENGDYPNTVHQVDFIRKPGKMKLNPVKITIIDDNTPPHSDDRANHRVTYELK